MIPIVKKPIDTRFLFGSKYLARKRVAWLYLAMAVVSEVIGLTVMSVAAQTHFVVAHAVLYLMVAASYVFLAKAVREISVGIAYAIWEGAGLAMITLVSALFLQQLLSTRELFGLLLAIVGMLLVNLGEVPLHGRTTK